MGRGYECTTDTEGDGINLGVAKMMFFICVTRESG